MPDVVLFIVSLFMFVVFVALCCEQGFKEACQALLAALVGAGWLGASYLAAPPRELIETRPVQVVYGMPLAVFDDGSVVKAADVTRFEAPAGSRMERWALPTRWSAGVYWSSRDRSEYKIEGRKTPEILKESIL